MSQPVTWSKAWSRYWSSLNAKPKNGFAFFCKKTFDPLSWWICSESWNYRSSCDFTLIFNFEPCDSGRSKIAGLTNNPFCLWQTFETFFFHHLRILRTCLDLGLRKISLTQSYISSNSSREQPSRGTVSKSILPLATASVWSFEWIESLATTTNMNSSHLEALSAWPLSSTGSSFHVRYPKYDIRSFWGSCIYAGSSPERGYPITTLKFYE